MKITPFTSISVYISLIYYFKATVSPFEHAHTFKLAIIIETLLYKIYPITFRARKHLTNNPLTDISQRFISYDKVTSILQLYANKII